MSIPEAAIFERPPADDIRSIWTLVFADPLLSLAKLKAQALSKAGLGEEDSDGGVTLRSVYWRFYHGLLPPPTSPSLFAPTLESSRSTYSALRRRYLVAPDGRWADDCSPDDAGSSTVPHSGTTEPDGGWDPLSLDGQSPWKTWFAHQDLRATIRQDVDRTFPDIEYFRMERVRRVMVATLFLYSVLNPDVGYRQGMHELLAVCLLAVDRDSLEIDTAASRRPSSSAQAIVQEAMRTTLDRRYVEHDSFGLFQALMRGAKPFYEWRAEEGPRTKTANALQAPIIVRCQNLHNTLLRRIDPQLWERFDTEGLEPQIWAIRWIRLIFTRELPFNRAMRLWDGFFAEDPGLVLVDFVCIALLLLIRNELLEADYSTLLTKLLRFPAPSDTYPLSPSLILAQAIYLRNNVTPAGGVEIVLQNQDVLGVKAAPPENADLPDQLRRKGQAGKPSGRVAQSPPVRPGVQGLAQGLYERAQAAGLDKTIMSTVADLRRNLPENYASYLPNLPFSPLGNSAKENEQFSSIPSNPSALPRSSFFSPPHSSVPARLPTQSHRPPVFSQPSADSDISIKSLRDAERDLAELRLAMVGMGKAMNGWMSALPVSEGALQGESWDGLGRLRDTLLDAAGTEVEDLVRLWGWNQGIESPDERENGHPVLVPHTTTIDTTPKVAYTPAMPDTPKAPQRPSMESPRSAGTGVPEPLAITKPPTLVTGRNGTPATGLPRSPQTTVFDSSRPAHKASTSLDPLSGKAPSHSLGQPMRAAHTMDPLAGGQLGTDPLGGLMAGSSKGVIWLFKAPPNSLVDAYATEITAAAYEYQYVPVLSETFQTTNLEGVFRDTAARWDGVIITSKRGAEGWIRAAKTVLSTSNAVDFSSTPLYTVGSTSFDLLATCVVPQDMLPDLANVRSAKSAVCLAEQMLAGQTSDQAPRSYLFIRGDKSTDELQIVLRRAGHTVREVQVYATVPVLDLAERTSRLIAEVRARSGDTNLWLAFFSPSSAAYALPHLKSLLHSGSTSDSAGQVGIRVFAIGETTARFLREAGYKVDAIAEEPSASGLVRAIDQAA